MELAEECIHFTFIWGGFEARRSLVSCRRCVGEGLDLRRNRATKSVGHSVC